MKNFSNGIDDYLKRLKKTVNSTKQKTAQTALRTLVTSSPVWSGAYVKSHRVGINEVDTTREPAMPISFLNKMSQAEAQGLKQSVYAKLVAEILATDFNDAIFISNSIFYANRVEYIGWRASGPYHPFGRAKMAIKAKTLLKSKSNAPIGI